MPPPAPNPLDLPEIIANLAPFLRRRELVVCARVSRHWHTMFEPWLWRQLKIVDSEFSSFTYHYRPPIISHMPETTLAKYAPLIQTLVSGGSEKRYLDVLTCPNLMDLSLYLPCRNQWSFVHRHHATLRRLAVYNSMYGQRAALDVAFWETTAACQSLISLTVMVWRIFLKDWLPCWRAWSRPSLTHLSISGLDFQPDPPLHLESLHPETATTVKPSTTEQFMAMLRQTAITSAVKSLEIEFSEWTDIEDDLLLLEWFPDLESFKWHPYDVGSQTWGGERRNHVRREGGLSIGEYLAKSARHCPKISSLTLKRDPKEEVEGLLPFLQSRIHSPLESLTLRGSWFGPASWKLVRTHHWETIRILKLRDTPQSWVDGAMVQDMLCSLPGLRKFQAPWLEDRDVRRDPRPWVCVGLTHLQVAIGLLEDDKSASQRMFFERISGLTHLRDLDLSAVLKATDHFRTYEQDSVGTLSFKLEYGLELLSSLKQLQALATSDQFAQVAPADVLWMLKHWPKWSKYITTVHSDPEVELAVRKILKESIEDGDRSIEVNLGESPSPQLQS